MINRVLSAIDIFGVSVPIIFSGKEKKTSSLGGMSSFLFFCFISWAIYNASEDFIAKTNPQTFKSENYSENPKQVIVSSITFPMRIQIRAPNSLLKTSYIDEQIYKLRVYQSFLQRIKQANGTIEEKWVFIDLITDKCTQEHFRETGSNFSDVELQTIHCLSENQPGLEEISIEGALESSVYSSLSISLTECDNSTSQTPCASKEILDKYLEGGWFNLLYANLAINNQDFYNPVLSFKDTYSTLISRGNPKTTKIELSNVAITTDIGWITQNRETLNFVKINKIGEFIQVGSNPEKILMLCNLEASKVQIDYLRSYKKIQNILAEVGGLANSTFIIFVILITPYLKFKLRESIMNELFETGMNTKGLQQKTTELEKSHEKHTPDDIESPHTVDKTYNKIPTEHIENKTKILKTKKNIGRLIRQLSASSLSLNQPKINFASSKDEGKKQHSPLIEPSSKPISLEKVSKSQESPLLRNSQAKKDLKSHFHHESCSSDVSALFSKHDHEDSMHASPNNFIIKKKSSGSSGNPSMKSKFDHQDSPIISKESKQNHTAIEILRRYTSKSKTTKTTEQELNEEEIRKRNRANSMQKCNNYGETNESMKKDRTHIKFVGLEMQEINVGEIRNKIYHLNDIINKSKGLKLTLWEYICSFIYRSSALKKKLEIIDKGIRNVDQRLDIINILKKLRELDKLKALLFDHDQLILFNNLPKPEISLNQNGNDESHGMVRKRTSFSRETLKKLTFVQPPGTEDQVTKSHSNIKGKQVKTNIDARLLEIFDDEDCSPILSNIDR